MSKTKPLLERNTNTTYINTTNVNTTDIDTTNINTKNNQLLSINVRNKLKKYQCHIFILVILLLTIAIVCGSILIYKHVSKTKNEINYYVLPNTSVTINNFDNNTIKGVFNVNYPNDLDFDFKSYVNESIALIEFTSQNENNISDNNWLGFKIYDYNNDVIYYEFYNKNNKYILKFDQEHKIDHNDTFLFETFLGDIIVEYFIELSFKLVSLGYVGNTTNYIQLHNIHIQAQLFYRISNMDNNVNNTEWVDLSDETEKLNAVNKASNNAGYWVTTMDDLVKYTSDEYSNNDDTNNGFHRRLGNCGEPYSRCNNDCFGLCGYGCTCWSWVCGDCSCWIGCEQHDHWCSCEGLTSWCCINVFWVKCDGSGSCG